MQNPVKIVENIRLDAPCSASAALALASTYALRYGSSAARAAVLREARQAAKARAAPKGHGCCAESLELQLPELPSAGLKVKWPAKLSVKRGEVIEILVVNDTGSKAGSLNGSNVLVWLVSDSALFGGHGHA